MHLKCHFVTRGLNTCYRYCLKMDNKRRSFLKIIHHTMLLMSQKSDDKNSHKDFDLFSSPFIIYSTHISQIGLTFTGGSC